MSPATVIPVFDPLLYRKVCLLLICKVLTVNPLNFDCLKKHSATALSKQLPFLLILWITRLFVFRILVNSWQAYRVPRSEWKINFWVIGRLLPANRGSASKPFVLTDPANLNYFAHHRNRRSGPVIAHELADFPSLLEKMLTAFCANYRSNFCLSWVIMAIYIL